MQYSSKGFKEFIMRHTFKQNQWGKGGGGEKVWEPAPTSLEWHKSVSRLISNLPEDACGPHSGMGPSLTL